MRPTADPDRLRLPLGPSRRSGTGRIVRAAAVVLAVFAVGLAASSATPFARATAAWASGARAALALTLLAAAAFAERIGSRGGRPRGWLVLDERGARRVADGPEAPVFDWAQPFGLTVLASVDRSRLALVITSPSASRCVAVRVRDVHDAARSPALLARASTAADSDLPDGDLALCAADAEQVLAAVARRAPAALERIYLSTADGESVALDCGELRVGDRRFDLRAPLEWRASYFQELGVQAASVCQATWVRQGDAEVVLVAPMAGERTWAHAIDAAVRATSGGEAVQRGMIRDSRLLRSTPASPPPRELRRAVDRMFVLPLRAALDRAPGIARAASRPRPEGRA